MKRLLFWIAAAVVAGFSAISASAAYQYYLTDVTMQGWGNWSWNGTPYVSSAGLTAYTWSWVSAISQVAVPDGTSDYEVRARVTLPGSGGNFVL